jgi:hypothetical protein
VVDASFGVRYEPLIYRISAMELNGITGTQ